MCRRTANLFLVLSLFASSPAILLAAEKEYAATVMREMPGEVVVFSTEETLERSRIVQPTAGRGGVTDIRSRVVQSGRGWNKLELTDQAALGAGRSYNVTISDLNDGEATFIVNVVP